MVAKKSFTCTLVFSKIDREVVEKFLNENEGILTKTRIKELCFFKLENWYYLYTFLSGKEEAKELTLYIKDYLKTHAKDSLNMAVLFFLTSSSLEDFNEIQKIIKDMLTNVKEKERRGEEKKIAQCLNDTKVLKGEKSG